MGGGTIMNDFKSVQDLIIKAALYDGISTTISPGEINGDTLKITFSNGVQRSATLIELSHRFRDPEEAALYGCKAALHDLMWRPYEEIECERKKTK
jgi:hypothetical protein